MRSASNTTGNHNTANGLGALFRNTTGVRNTANGFLALVNNTTGTNNIGLGNSAGSNLTTGNNNIEIGNVGVAAEANTIRIGTIGTQQAAFVAGISGEVARRMRGRTNRIIRGTRLMHLLATRERLVEQYHNDLFAYSQAAESHCHALGFRIVDSPRRQPVQEPPQKVEAGSEDTVQNEPRQSRKPLANSALYPQFMQNRCFWRGGIRRTIAENT
ncbi:MAG: hypothetical protein ACRESZ_10095 [Methylococcales bacterium]